MLPLDVWQVIEFWMCCGVAAGCLWQLVYDGKFAIVKTWSNVSARLGLIVQIVFALGGMGDAFRCREAHVLFIGYTSGTALIQASLLYRWLRHGRPSTLY